MGAIALDSNGVVRWMRPFPAAHDGMTGVMSSVDTDASKQLPKNRKNHPPTWQQNGPKRPQTLHTIR